jgi:hypothetical protein
MCRSIGVTPQEYLANNSKTFTSNELSRNLAKSSDSLASALTITTALTTFEPSWQLSEP